MITLTKSQSKLCTRWWKSDDTGLSSKAIFLNLILDLSLDDYPLDVSDFGRCYRILKKLPFLVKEFPKMAKINKIWELYVNHWDEMSQLFEEELKDNRGRAPKLYKLMGELQETVRIPLPIKR